MATRGLAPYLHRGRRALCDRSGVALIEFALSLPVLVTLIFVGVEVANYAIALQRISQIATMTADNASRLRTQMTEGYVNQLFTGVDKAGAAINFKQHGRVILSSIQNNSAGNGQWIRWQRCFGDYNIASHYGTEGKGQSDQSLLSVRTLTAQPGSAIMFAEVRFQYQSLVPMSFLNGRIITYESAFIVRQRTDFGISGTMTASCPTA